MTKKKSFHRKKSDHALLRQFIKSESKQFSPATKKRIERTGNKFAASDNMSSVISKPIKPVVSIKQTLDGYCATFTIGVQTFSTSTVDTSAEARWYGKMLRIALKTLVDSHKKKK